MANTTHAASNVPPAYRMNRTALSIPVTRLATDTWHTTIEAVFNTNSADTVQPGALVRSTIHSGIANVIIGMCSCNTMFNNDTSA